MNRVFAAKRGSLVGHRGGRGDSWPPENTIAAFARAIEGRAEAVELDVRTCAGDDVVVMHDADLARMTRGADRRVVATLTLGELGATSLTGRGGDSLPERIPTLDHVLEWAKGRAALNVEAKHDVPDRLALARSIARTLARHEGVEVLLSSFDPTLLAMLAVAAPTTPRAWLTHQGQHRWERIWALLAARAPIDAVHLERTQASPRVISAFQRGAKCVGVWTVNDPKEARDLAALGVDWIITDDAGELRAGDLRLSRS